MPTRPHGPAYALLQPADLSEPTRRRFLLAGAVMMGFAASGKAWAQAKGKGEQPTLRVDTLDLVQLHCPPTAVVTSDADGCAAIVAASTRKGAEAGSCAATGAAWARTAPARARMQAGPG